MADAAAVLPPGWKALDANGEPIPDATLSFFLANTSTPTQVYADRGLLTSLGTSVSCNSTGSPVSSGDSKTRIYIGALPYRIRLDSTSLGNIFDFQEVQGALDTSDFLTTAAVARKSVTPTATDRTIAVNEIGSLINFNPTAGTLTATVPAPATAANGWWIAVAHGGTANAVRIISDGSATFRLNGVDVTSFSLTSRGQTAYIVTDGTSYFVDIRTPGVIEGGPGIIKIVSRANTPPGSPAAGDRHIVTASPAGDWSSFSQHDIAEANGFGGWFRYTPPADAGWAAYVQAEDLLYVRVGTAWETIRHNAGKSTLFPAEDIYPGALVAVIEDVKASGTNGGTFTSGADQTRTLNTLSYNRNTTVSLSNGTTGTGGTATDFTLPAGTWEIKWAATAFRVDQHETILRDVTAGADLARGTSEFSGNADYAPTRSTGTHVVTIASPNTYAIRHRCAATRAVSDARGIAGGFGVEKYAFVEIRVA